MKLSLSSARNVALGLVIALAVTAWATTGAAQSTTNSAAPVKKHHHLGALAAANGGNSVQQLDQAYGILAKLDHDYKGHRVEAMHKIEAAAKALGSPLHGGGKGGESQAESDASMHQAQSLLENALPGLVGKPRHHAREAIHQLTIALSVK